ESGCTARRFPTLSPATKRKTRRSPKHAAERSHPPHHFYRRHDRGGRLSCSFFRAHGRERAAAAPRVVAGVSSDRSYSSRPRPPGRQPSRPEVKVDKAIENTVERIKDDLIKVAKEKNIPITEAVRQGTQIRVRAPAASADKIRDLQKSEFSNLAVVNSQVSGGTADMVLTLTEKELRSLRDQTVEQSLETIRNRIDQFGVSEPVIQRQGQQEILVQLPGVQDPEEAKKLIQQTAVLEFKLVDDSHSVEDALKSGPPPGTQILYGQDRAPYLLQAQPLMTGAYIADAHVRPSSRLEGPYVELVLTNTGARLFERITAE